MSETFINFLNVGTVYRIDTGKNTPLYGELTAYDGEFLTIEKLNGIVVMIHESIINNIEPSTSRKLMGVA